MPTWNIGDCLHGFRVERKDILPHLNAHYWKLTHEKTGAALYYSDRDDGQMVFSVGFRTLPEDDTGVFHIIEHSVLDGSESFRLKQPFVNLMKTSLFVFLNAVTYPDKTFYYFSSSDERAFMNMMSVYLDAVFHPLALSDRRIFEKEAWHLEPDGEGGVRCSGVVFNEMQDSDSQPASRLYAQHNRQLFPDLHYRFISGGDPAAIRSGKPTHAFTVRIMLCSICPERLGLTRSCPKSTAFCPDYRHRRGHRLRPLRFRRRLSVRTVRCITS